MKKLIEDIKSLILLAIFFVIFSTIIDYVRMNGGETPIFNIKEYDNKTQVETFKGVIYRAYRTVRISRDESILDSSNLKFKILNYDLKITNQFKNEKFDFTMLTKQINDCHENSKLYYADLNTKIYTYCFSSIKLKELGKPKSKELIEYLKEDGTIIEDIVTNLSFMGLDKDKRTMIFRALDDSFSNNELVIYRCNLKNINDIYIAPKGTQKLADFCTAKDDDWDFLWTIEKKEDKNNTPPEFDIFYQDETNYYGLENFNKNNVYLVTPEVRGKKGTKISLVDAIKTKGVTLEELEKRGLKYKTIEKSEFNKEKKEG